MRINDRAREYSNSRAHSETTIRVGGLLHESVEGRCGLGKEALRGSASDGKWTPIEQDVDCSKNRRLKPKGTV